MPNYTKLTIATETESLQKKHNLLQELELTMGTKTLPPTVVESLVPSHSGCGLDYLDKLGTWAG